MNEQNLTTILEKVPGILPNIDGETKLATILKVVPEILTKIDG